MKPAQLRKIREKFIGLENFVTVRDCGRIEINVKEAGTIFLLRLALSNVTDLIDQNLYGASYTFGGTTGKTIFIRPFKD